MPKPVDIVTQVIAEADPYEAPQIIAERILDALSDEGHSVVLSAYHDPETVARAFHRHYERMAPWFNYTTREASAVPWEDVPSNNQELMLAVAACVMGDLGFPVEWYQATKHGEVIAQGATARDVLVSLKRRGITGSIMSKVRP